MSNAKPQTMVITTLDEVKTEFFKSLFEVVTTVESREQYMTPMKCRYIHFHNIRFVDLLESGEAKNGSTASGDVLHC